jgi:hypothetical protein
MGGRFSVQEYGDFAALRQRLFCALHKKILRLDIHTGATLPKINNIMIIK